MFFETEKSKVVELFYKIVDDINEIKNSMKKYEGELEKRNIDIPIPQTDHVAFTECLHCDDKVIFGVALNRMIEAEKVNNMLIGQ